jgi:SAM-dependent methyltransferase
MDKSLYDNIYQVEETHWWYKARRDIVFDWIRRILLDYEQPRVLDVGCGTGFNVSWLNRIGYERVDGLDISDDALSYCKSRQLCLLINASAENLPVRHSVYDVILTLDIIEHLENDLQALAGIFRALKEDGSLIVFVPAYQFLWSFQDEISHHKRRYDAKGLRDKMTRAGFVVKKLTYVNSFLLPVVWLGRLALRTFPGFFSITSENQMSPSWMNKILYYVFRAELPLLRYVDFPFGVSILCICRKPEAPAGTDRPIPRRELGGGE